VRNIHCRKGRRQGTLAGHPDSGLGGNDSIAGNRANDKIFGGVGNDRITGAAGTDIVDGGIGFDQCVGSTIQNCP